MMIAPLRVVNLPPSNFGIFSVSCDGSGIITPTTVSPTLIAGAAVPAVGGRLDVVSYELNFFSREVQGGLGRVNFPARFVFSRVSSGLRLLRFIQVSFFLLDLLEFCDTLLDR
jgi:hypothetical protein